MVEHQQSSKKKGLKLNALGDTSTKSSITQGLKHTSTSYKTGQNATEMATGKNATQHATDAVRKTGLVEKLRGFIKGLKQKMGLASDNNNDEERDKSLFEVVGLSSQISNILGKIGSVIGTFFTGLPSIIVAIYKTRKRRQQWETFKVTAKTATTILTANLSENTRGVFLLRGKPQPGEYAANMGRNDLMSNFI